MDDNQLSELIKILSYKRKANSLTEAYFIHRFIDSKKPTFVDKYGNRIFIIGRNITTMFCCHVDTVHNTAGKQSVSYDSGMNILYLTNGSDGCLGADNGAEIWLMLNLIKRGIHGVYVFHRREEAWGKGSFYFSNKYSNFIKSLGVRKCISFDCGGVTSVITHQYVDKNRYLGGESPVRTCSDHFAQELCWKLHMGHVTDPRGVFTDSAAYCSIIPECTNILVGYFNSYMSDEFLDIMYLGNLLNSLLKVDWDKLYVKRCI